MSYTHLAQAIRTRAKAIEATIFDHADYEDRRDDVELLRCLARILSGDPVRKAFGAPGDWGYDTPVGDALREDYAAGSASGTSKEA